MAADKVQFVLITGKTKTDKKISLDTSRVLLTVKRQVGTFLSPEIIEKKYCQKVRHLFNLKENVILRLEIADLTRE